MNVSSSSRGWTFREFVEEIGVVGLTDLTGTKVPEECRQSHGIDRGLLENVEHFLVDQRAGSMHSSSSLWTMYDSTYAIDCQ